MAQSSEFNFNHLLFNAIAAAAISLSGCLLSDRVATSEPADRFPLHTATETVKTKPPGTSVARTPAQPYSRRPAVLNDLAKPNTSFYEFRNRLRQAVKERDAEYIRAIAAPNIKLSFGLPMRLDELDLDNPNSLFWKRLERIINIGCAPFEGSPEIVATANAQVWICPHLFQAVQIDDPYTDIFIVGENVNVRSQPSTDSPAIAVLSNEVVRVDPMGFEILSQEQREVLETNRGWRPIITPQGDRGFVSSRYAYSPMGYRAYFVNEGDGWFMTVFLVGD